MNPLAPWLGLIERSCNRLLRAHPEARAHLARLEGKVMALHVLGTGMACYVRFHTHGVALLGEAPIETHVAVAGPPFALARALAARDADLSAVQGEVSISGDVALARRVKALFEAVDVQWEEHLSSVVGDPAARRLGNTLRGLNRWASRSLGTLLVDAGEYVTEEARLVPARSELEAFAAAVDLLRDDVDRLEARAQRLQERGS